MEICTPVLYAEDPRHINWKGGSFLFFGGYDYYRLSQDSRVVSAAAETLEHYGLNCGGSRVTTGNHPLHVELESVLAKYLHTADAALLPSGYMANLAIFDVLKNKGMICYYHPECHPSLKNAISMNNITAYAIPSDASGFEEMIRRKGNRPLIVTDGIYGDLPPLDTYSKLVEIFDGLLLIDEAHSLGILGKHGRGAAEHFGINMKRVLISGSLSKAVGTGGGFAAGPAEFIEQLRATCAYATTSALSLPIVSAGTASLRLLSAHPEMILNFQQRCLNAKKILNEAGYDIPPVPSPVISIHLSDTRFVDALKKALIAHHIYPSLIRYPGKSDYFRFALSSVHTEEDISSLLNVLCTLRSPA